MANQYFSIKEQVFDIQFTNRSLVHELQNRVSRLANDRLIHEMNGCFEKIIPGDIILKFDSLTIDIGEIDYHSLDEELVPKIIEALEQQLTLQLSLLKDGNAGSHENNASAQPVADDTTLLEYFLLNGTLPWWSQSNTPGDLDLLINNLFSKNPSSLRLLILRVGRNEYVRARIVSIFKEETIRMIIKALEPSEAVFILGYHKEVVSIQQKEQVVQAETAVFAKAVWLFILTYLLADRGGEFNRKTFVKNTIAGMAARFNINYYELLRLFYEAVTIEVNNNRQTSSLETFVRELTAEEEIYHDELLQNNNYVLPETAPVKDAVTLSRKADIVMHYLRYGSLPAGANMYSHTQLLEMFAELTRDVPNSVRFLLAEINSDLAIAERYFNLTGWEKGKEVLLLLYPRAAKLLFTLSSVIELIEGKKPVLNTDGSSLKKMSRNITVSVLFRLGDQEDDILLLHTFLTQLATQYGETRQKLVTTVNAGILEEFRSGMLNTDLPQLLKILETRSPAIEETNAVNEQDKETKKNEQGLLDALIYLVQYGHIAWWARNYFINHTVDELLKKLLSSSREEAIQLVRIAGNEWRSQKRLLSFSSLDTFFDLMVVLPSGQEAVAKIKQASKWFENGTEGKLAGREAISKIMLHVIWDEMISYGYRSFSLAAFYSHAIIRVAADLATEPITVGIALEKGMIKEITDGNPGLVEEKEILDGIVELLNKEIIAEQEAIKNNEGATKEEKIRKDFFIKRFFSQLSKKEINAFLKNLPAQEQKQVTATRQIILRSSARIRLLAANEAKEILRYYFVWNRLPDDIAAKEITGFIKNMLLLIYAVDPMMIVSLLQEDHAFAETQTKLVSLLNSNAGGIEKRLVALLSETAIDQHNKGTQAEEKTGNINIGATEPERKLRTLLTTTTKGREETAPSVHSEAVQIIEHFFRWNRLPDQWKETGLSTDVILKQLLLILYRENRIMLQRLLQERIHVPAARLFFQQLVSVSAGGVEKEAALFIQPYKEIYQLKLLEIPLAVTDLQDTAGYSTTESPMATATQLVEAIELFLTTNQLQQTGYPVLNTEIKLVQAVVQLYTIDQTALQRVLSKQTYSASAKVRMQDLFIAQTGYQEREVLRLLEQSWQQDLLNLLAEKELIIDRNNPADPARILFRLLSSDKKNQKEAELWALAISSPLFVRYLTEGGPSIQKKLIEKTGIGWGGDTVDFMQGLRNLFEIAIPNKLERDKLLAVFMQFNLLFLSGKLILKSREAYLNAFFTYLMRTTHTIPVSVFSGVLDFVQQGKITSSNVLAGAVDRLRTELLQTITHFDGRFIQKQEWSLVEAEATRAEKEQQNARRLEEIRAELEKQKELEEERRKKESEKLKEGKNNKIYIRNAGLVLFHPFLGTYFSRLGLIEKGQFVDDAAQQRAVLLLQYLVNGRTEVEEFELALNKILCGLPVEETVPQEIILTEDEINLSAELFQVIFQRWEKMKNTTVEGFRASFIQREGALSRGEENWELRVEQRTYDLLLNTLPWAFGMIKNTWMNQILTVEWT